METRNSSSAKTLYRTIWRWHFYAGLFCIPFIISLAVTGSIYLFKPQIDAWSERAYRSLPLSGERASAQQHIDAALAALPGSSFGSYRLPENNNHAIVITAKQQGKNFLVYVHPHSLEVLGSVASDKQFIRLVRSFHGELLLGNTGSVLVELAGCWAIVMILTGLYLWWPRSASGLAGVLYPRLAKGGRQFLRDLHAVTGFWVAFFTLFLLISGLPWALVWGTAFKEIRSLNKPPVEQTWSVSHQADSEHQHHAHHGMQQSETGLLLTDSLLEKVKALNFASPVELSPARGKPGQWQVSSQHQNRVLRADAWFDGESEALLNVKTFGEKSAVDKAVGIGISAHEGHLFGWLNQLLGLFTALGLLLVSVSGFILWRKRKPDGVLGAPPVMADARIGLTIASITLILALFLPLLLLSLVVLTVLEYMCFRHVPALRVWLGLKAV